jgi:hypothetical protein
MHQTVPYRYALVALAAAIVLFVTGIPIIHRHHSQPATDTLATQIGATNCADSGYYINRYTDGKKLTIYDCGMPSGRELCVTEEGGIATNATETVRLLFRKTFGAKPSCLG